MRHTPLFLCLTVAALAASASADDVTTKTGAVYSGKIVSENDAAVVLDTPTLGRLKISRADIAKVRRDAPDAAAAGGAAKPADATKPGDAKSPPAADKKTAEKKPVAEKKPAATAAAKPADVDENGLTADERDERRRTAKIVRHTASTTAKPAAEAAAAAAPDAKATFGGSQLAQVAAESWIVVFQPPKPFEPAPAGLQIGRRIFARVESIGSASAWLAQPTAGVARRIAVGLADVQNHFVTTADAPRVRMLEGIDQGAWLRVRLDDGTTVQGSLKSVQNGTATLTVPGVDGKSSTIEVVDHRIVEIDGLVRSTASRFAIAEAAVGENVALTSWPDGREVVGVLKERDEKLLTIESPDGVSTKFAVDGPIAELRRVPGKWRVLASNLDSKMHVHVKSAEEFPDARVERDVVGRVAAVTAYAVTLHTPEGMLVLPFESMTAFEAGDFEAVPTKPMKTSDRACKLPALPGDPDEKAKGVDPAGGVSVVSDGTVVKHVFVSAPFEGEVFGIRIHDRVAEALEKTDLRFDSTVAPRAGADVFAKPAETTSNSLAGMRVTLVLDADQTVSAIEVAAR
jgi:hypothetical protein